MSISEILANCGGITEEYLRTKGSWVSVRFEDEFIRSCIIHTNMNDLPFKVGKYSWDKKYIGEFVWSLFKHLMTVKQIYKLLERYIRHYNRIVEIESQASDSGFKLMLKPISKSLTEEEQKILTDRLPDIANNMAGYFSMIPKVKGNGYIPAQVIGVFSEEHQISIEFAYKNNDSKIIRVSVGVLLGIVFCATLAYFPFLIASLIILTCYTLHLNLLVYRYKRVISGANVALEEADSKYKKINSLLTVFRKFVSPKSLKWMNYKSIEECKVGDRVIKDLAVMFCDLRGFTSMCETMSDDDIRSFFYSYMKHMGPIIERNGIIDNIIGDAILSQTEPPIAVETAIEFLNALDIYNKQHRSSNPSSNARSGGPRVPLEARIGIDSGFMQYGLYGFSGKIQFTALSSIVNRASRLCDLTKLLGARILCSESVINRMPDNINFRWTGRFKLRGMSEHVNVFEILLPNESQKICEKEDIERAIRYFVDDDHVNAAKLFRGLSEDDGLVSYYLSQIANIEISKPLPLAG